MAIGTPTAIGSNTGTGTTVVITTTATAVVGTRIIVECGGSSTVSGVADSAGNTYALDRQHSNGGANVTIASAPVTTQLTSGGTITVTYAAGVNFIAAAQSVSGLEPSAAVDQVNSQTQFGATAWNSGNVTTVQNDELLVGVSHCAGIVGGTSSTPDANLNELADQSAGNNTMTSVYRILTSIGTYAASGTWLSAAGGPDDASAVVTYKAAPPPALTDEAALRTAHTPVTWRT